MPGATGSVLPPVDGCRRFVDKTRSVKWQYILQYRNEPMRILLISSMDFCELDIIFFDWPLDSNKAKSQRVEIAGCNRGLGWPRLGMLTKQSESWALVFSRLHWVSRTTVSKFGTFRSYLLVRSKRGETQRTAETNMQTGSYIDM